MDDRVTLVGLDFGTTTSSAVIASANLERNSVTGRMELRSVEPRYQPEPVFTPFAGDQLDEARLADYLEQWLNEIRTGEVFGGGAMITGLAAQASNAAAFAGSIRRHLKDAIVAAADDPCLESWLAFMGNCFELSLANPDRVFLNFDIGGGTTNIALGRNGEVMRTGCLFVGARHIQFESGSYRITALSSYGRRLLNHLRIHKDVGDHLTEDDVHAIVDWYLDLLENAVTGLTPEGDSLTALHQQVPFGPGPDLVDAGVTLSGGVGYLAYRGLQTGEFPTTTAYGDLGVEMARRLCQRPFWGDRLSQYLPSGLGRATLFGLLRHNTQVSGTTLYLSDERVLPLNDLVILGTVSPATQPAEIERLVTLAGRTAQGACLRVDLARCDRASIRGLAETLRTSILKRSENHDVPLVLFVRENLGKVLGQFVTNWGVSAAKVVVIDEVDAYRAQFACIGRLQQGVLPVSLHGMTSTGGTS